ncbi:carbohydrate kinase family protein [Cellulomonas fimi]|uniref:PfkB domain protein n=1 Tax=Cellulomonas fimi (strain ATCC 484 / DSM 20113 / JCM 1341 / CCUG 24087 / LMG 16345 / NBRC 15513 / NCIMB 8980 / NCTC 7547 / NRS-133) TaxID=590998 RepID=F4H2U6_CELFA|nr:PfkB family carbohydrate kinase [Cellulomonas fimi]AEE46445.1 PfkB domain protein [Cellulomonas fimi ATCC 484]NNH07737.1 carbohydrate kinase family protein [Cellulomonas fimi]VEH33031.1 fructoselysine 6-kinase [Cellulomonas fimi]
MPHVLVNGPASWNTVVRLPSLPEPRSATLFAREHHDGLGGTSAGKARTLAALGLDVTLRTVLGDDEQAARVRAALAHDRLTVLAESAAAGRTERHVNLLADDGARLSLYLTLPAPQRPADPVPADVLAALARADAAVVDLADHSRPLLAAARAAGVPLWCDVHDDDGTAAYARDFAGAADVLLVSADRLADPAAYLDAAVRRGARLAVCTSGAAGALARDADGWWDVPAAPVDAVVDADGAGDAFLAGLLHAVLDGLPHPQALARASAAGALAVTSPGVGAAHVTAAAVASLAERVAVRAR